MKLTYSEKIFGEEYITKSVTVNNSDKLIEAFGEAGKQIAEHWMFDCYKTNKPDSIITFGFDTLNPNVKNIGSIEEHMFLFKVSYTAEHIGYATHWMIDWQISNEITTEKVISFLNATEEERALVSSHIAELDEQLVGIKNSYAISYTAIKRISNNILELFPRWLHRVEEVMKRKVQYSSIEILDFLT